MGRDGAGDPGRGGGARGGAARGRGPGRRLGRGRAPGEVRSARSRTRQGRPPLRPLGGTRSALQERRIGVTMAGTRLAGKVAIVTGAGSRGEGIGNGRAAAVLFAREGAKVLLVDQGRAAADETLRMIRGEGGEAAVFTADVTRGEECRAMVEEA